MVPNPATTPQYYPSAESPPQETKRTPSQQPSYPMASLKNQAAKRIPPLNFLPPGKT